MCAASQRLIQRQVVQAQRERCIWGRGGRTGASRNQTGATRAQAAGGGAAERPGASERSGGLGDATDGGCRRQRESGFGVCLCECSGRREPFGSEAGRGHLRPLQGRWDGFILERGPPDDWPLGWPRVADERVLPPAGLARLARLIMALLSASGSPPSSRREPSANTRVYPVAAGPVDAEPLSTKRNAPGLHPLRCSIVTLIFQKGTLPRPVLAVVRQTRPAMALPYPEASLWRNLANTAPSRGCAWLGRATGGILMHHAPCNTHQAMHLES